MVRTHLRPPEKARSDHMLILIRPYALNHSGNHRCTLGGAGMGPRGRAASSSITRACPCTDSRYHRHCRALDRGEPDGWRAPRAGPSDRLGAGRGPGRQSSIGCRAARTDRGETRSRLVGLGSRALFVLIDPTPTRPELDRCACRLTVRCSGILFLPISADARNDPGRWTSTYLPYTSDVPAGRRRHRWARSATRPAWRPHSPIRPGHIG